MLCLGFEPRAAGFKVHVDVIFFSTKSLLKRFLLFAI